MATRVADGDYADFDVAAALHIESGMTRLACSMFCLVAMSGCFFGRNPTAKTIAYASNGALVGVGLLSASGTRDSDETQVGHVLGALAVTAGVLGIILNLAVPTDQPGPPITAGPADGNAASITY
jgi:hypothetical protein